MPMPMPTPARRPRRAAASAATAQRLFALLAERHPHADIELSFQSPLELLVATILSAQCTDVRVNMVTPALFRKYPTAQSYIDRPAAELEEDIRTTGFFRNKAKSIRGAMERIVHVFHGQVPDTIEQLVSLPGVGRKTANVILGNAFGKPGIVVDTHVGRVARRLNLTQQTDPVKVEFDLQKLFDPRDWTRLSHTLVIHGRYVCKARKPLCSDCPLPSLCPFYAARNRAPRPR